MPIKKFLLYTMTCGCITRSALGTPHGATVWCMKHRKRVAIDGIQVGEWRAKCITNDKCHYSHFTGMSKEIANQSANAHYRNTWHSAISVQFEDNPVAVAELARWERLGVWLRKSSTTESTTTPSTTKTTATQSGIVKKTPDAPDSMTAYPTAS